MHAVPHHRSTPIAKVPQRLIAIATAVLVLSAGGCAMNETGQRTGTGAAIGALGGAVLGTSRQSAALTHYMQQ